MDGGDSDTSPKSKLSRVDFLGAILLVGTVLSCLLALDLGTKGLPCWLLGTLCTCFVVFLGLFLFVEASVAKEPIFPLYLLAKPDVQVSCLVMAIHASAQFGVSYYQFREAKWDKKIWLKRRRNIHGLTI